MGLQPFFLPDDHAVVMGYIRMTAQGSAQNNDDHPFRGSTGGTALPWPITASSITTASCTAP